MKAPAPVPHRAPWAAISGTILLILNPSITLARLEHALLPLSRSSRTLQTRDTSGPGDDPAPLFDTPWRLSSSSGDSETAIEGLVMEPVDFYDEDFVYEESAHTTAARGPVQSRADPALDSNAVPRDRVMHSETRDHITSLTATWASNNRIDWVIEQRGRSCALLWFNTSHPHTSEFEVQGMTGMPQHHPSATFAGQDVWVGLFSVQAREDIDMVFDSICSSSGYLPLSHYGATLTVTDAAFTGNKHDAKFAAKDHQTSESAAAADASSLSAVSAPVLRTTNEVFLLIRNRCDALVTVTLSESVSTATGTAFFERTRSIMLQIVAMALGASVMLAVGFLVLVMHRCVHSSSGRTHSNHRDGAFTFPWSARAAGDGPRRSRSAFDDDVASDNDDDTVLQKLRAAATAARRTTRPSGTGHAPSATSAATTPIAATLSARDSIVLDLTAGPEDSGLEVAELLRLQSGDSEALCDKCDKAQPSS